MEHIQKAIFLNKEKKLEILQFILLCIGIIRERFEPVQSSEDFFKDSEGFMRLDSIAMRLFQISEAMSEIYEIDGSNLSLIIDSDYWVKMISIRDIFLNTNIELDADIIFNICNSKLDEIENSILKYLEALTVRDRY